MPKCLDDYYTIYCCWLLPFFFFFFFFYNLLLFLYWDERGRTASIDTYKVGHEASIRRSCKSFVGM